MYARVLVDIIIGHEDRIFDYAVPESLKAKTHVGTRVFIPFGPKQIEGFVLEINSTTSVPADKLKEITKIPDEFIALKPEAIQIVPQICKLFKLRIIDVLRLFVPTTIRSRKRIRKPQNKELKSLDIVNKKINLTETQKSVITEILKSNQDNANTFLLHGVTGSGKTEVYLNVIAKVLEQGKTAIVLVPEIGLTPQTFSNFKLRFGDTISMLHSGLTPAEKYDQWFRLHNGDARIAIGARSAIFAPLENIGVIIIDEEHDTSYFSESNPRFSTHEIACIRAQYNSCPVVLGSATPSIESYYRATKTSPDYKLLELDRRALGQPMPKIQIVDMTAEIRCGNGGIFSRALITALSNVLDQKKQSMIFLNRRGYSSSIMCKQCGWVATCENCDISLVWHKDENLLKCHYCPSRFTKPNKCQKCSSTMLKYGTTGTQKLVEELETIFPNTKIFRLDADTTKTKDGLLEILSDFAKTTPSILVGTQMIAKGHDFPNVELVGLIDTDNSLHFSDYRACERTFALVTQVAGRAGRSNNLKNSGLIPYCRGDILSPIGHEHNPNTPSVFLQTYKPSHYTYRYAANYDYKKFFEKELNMRQTTKYPPFTTIIRILITGEIDQPIRDLIQKIMTDLKEKSANFIYLGAMKSPLGRIQNKFRYQILARFPRETQTLDFITEVIRTHQQKLPKSIQVFLEINPQSLS